MTLELELTMNQPSTATIKRGLRAKANLLHDSDFGIIDKKEIENSMADFKKTNGKKKNTQKKPKPVQRITVEDLMCEQIEYEMSKELAETVLTHAKKHNDNRPPQEILCDYVNTQHGLKGYCVRVFAN